MRRVRTWGVIAAGVAVVALGGAGATLSAQSTGDTAGTDSATITATTGEQTYGEVCKACHMAQAQGGMGAVKTPALASNPKLADADFAVTRVLRGRGGMPAFAEILSPEQIAGVVGYVRTHFGNGYDGPVTVDDVKRLSPVAESN